MIRIYKHLVLLDYTIIYLQIYHKTYSYLLSFVILEKKKKKIDVIYGNYSTQTREKEKVNQSDRENYRELLLYNFLRKVREKNNKFYKLNLNKQGFLLKLICPSQLKCLICPKLRKKEVTSLQYIKILGNINIK